MHLTSVACGSWWGGVPTLENPGAAGLGGGSLMRAECLRCLGVGYEFENLEVNEVVWMGVCG